MMNGGLEWCRGKMGCGFYARSCRCTEWVPNKSFRNRIYVGLTRRYWLCEFLESVHKWKALTTSSSTHLTSHPEHFNKAHQIIVTTASIPWLRCLDMGLLIYSCLRRVAVRTERPDLLLQDDWSCVEVRSTSSCLDWPLTEQQLQLPLLGVPASLGFHELAARGASFFLLDQDVRGCCATLTACRIIECHDLSMRVQNATKYKQ